MLENVVEDSFYNRFDHAALSERRRGLITLPTDIERVNISISNRNSSATNDWSTDRLCILQFQEASGHGGLPSRDKSITGVLPENYIEIYGIGSRHDEDYRQTSSPSLLLISNKEFKSGDFLPIDRFPLLIKRIRIATGRGNDPRNNPQQIFVFNAFYFD